MACVFLSAINWSLSPSLPYAQVRMLSNGMPACWAHWKKISKMYETFSRSDKFHFSTNNLSRWFGVAWHLTCYKLHLDILIGCLSYSTRLDFISFTFVRSVLARKIHAIRTHQTRWFSEWYEVDINKIGKLLIIRCQLVFNETNAIRTQRLVVNANV